MPAPRRTSAVSRARCVAGTLLCACASTLHAAETITVQIDAIDGGEWTASRLEARLAIGADALGVKATIGSLHLPAPIGELEGVSVSCPAIQTEGEVVRCARASVRLAASPLDARPFTASVSYEPRTRRLSVVSQDVPALDQRIAIDATWRPQGWTLKLSGRELAAQRVYPLLASLSGVLPATEVAAGTASFEIEAASSGDGLQRLRSSLQVAQLTLSNAEGTLATENAAATVEFELEPARPAQPERFRLSARADAGEAYFEPAYFDLGKRPLQIRAQGQLDRDRRLLTLAPLHYEHKGALRGQVSGTFGWGERLAIREARIELHDATLPAAYSTYLQGFLVGTPLAKLQTRGSVAGLALVENDRLQAADLELSGLHADDAEQRVAIYGVDGQLHWRRSGAAPPTRIDWDGGFVYEIGYGAGAATLDVGPGRIALVGGLRVPVLDGALVIETFSARGLRGAHPEFDFDARLEPIGLRRLTAAFDWPAFPGTLAGELPLMSLRDGVVTLGGSLTVRAFDGTARISNLRIEEPFGGQRRGSADIAIDNLDLALLTDVFSLGRIEGRLDARIENLRTLRSEPVAFDARFYTTPGDRSRHRISRRALSNISEIAGGSAFLASGFLALFEQFSYRELGVSCKLQRDVCLMGGVAPAEDGYYIVKGKGLPRIDVIGHSREVNWPQLVAQITEALKSQDFSTEKPSENAQ